MNDLVGIIRNASEMRLALKRIEEVKERTRTMKTGGGREYNPGWHLALDLPKQLLVSQCIAESALMREESRGGHTRDDFPAMDPEWRKVNLQCSLIDGHLSVTRKDLPVMTAELAALFDVKELGKYMTQAEIDALAQRSA